MGRKQLLNQVETKSVMKLAGGLFLKYQEVSKTTDLLFKGT